MKKAAPEKGRFFFVFILPDYLYCLIMNRNYISMTLLFLLFAAQSAVSEEIIREIHFIGLKRTRESTALQIIRPVEPGQVFDETTEKTIIQELREAGIFNPEITVESRVTGSDVIIDVYLRDKWTLIPIPIFSFSQNGSWRAGALAIEGNLLGFYKTLGLGLFFGSEGWSLLSFYSDNIFLDTDLKFTASVNLGLNEVVDENVAEETVREYQTDEAGLGFSLEYPFTEKFSLTAGWDYDRSALRPGSTVMMNIPDLNSTGLTARAAWKDLYYDIPYEYGLLTTASYTWNWGLDGTAGYPEVRGRVNWGIRPAWDHLLLFTARGGWSSSLPVQKQFRLGGFPGTMNLPMDRIAADEYASAAAVYNVPVWHFPGGTLSVKGFYEAGYLQSDLIDRTLFHGPGGGIEIFINNLAIPAIQMNIGWNLETGRYQFSAGIGAGGGNPNN